MTLIDKLAIYACGLKYENLPKNVVDKANDALFDLIGCYYGAFTDPIARKVLLNVKKNGNEATLWGTGIRTASDEVALACGFLGYSLEYDDGVSLGGHWGSASIPAFVASAEKYGKSGRDLILAISLGYEIGTRISRIYSATLLKNKIHFPCTMGFYSAASGIGKLMDLNVEEYALGLANGVLAPVAPYATAVGGGTIKSLYSGWPNFLAIRMMEFAKNGIGGTTDIFEAAEGLGVIFKGHPLMEEEFREAVDGLGEKFFIMESYFKPYPCCRWLHASLYLLQMILKKYDNKEVKKVIVSGPSFLSLYDKRGDFSQKIKAQYSIPYTMAAMLLHKDCGIAEFEESFRNSKELSEATKKIEVLAEVCLDMQFPKKFVVGVTVIYADGSIEKREGGLPWGPDNPATGEELICKFRSLTKSVLPEKIQESFISIYKEGIERDGVFDRMMELLSIDVF